MYIQLDLQSAAEACKAALFLLQRKLKTPYMLGVMRGGGPLAQRLGFKLLSVLLLVVAQQGVHPSCQFQLPQRSSHLLGRPPPPLQPALGLGPTPYARLASRAPLSPLWAAVSAVSQQEAPPLPLWDKVFSPKLLFSESLPSVIPPLHAALLAKANLAARAARSYARGFGVFGGGASTVCAAVAAASLAAFGSWRLLSFASKSLRGLNAQVGSSVSSLGLQ